MTKAEFNEYLANISKDRVRGIIEALKDIGELVDTDVSETNLDGGYEMVIDYIDDRLATLENGTNLRYSNLIENKGKLEGYYHILHLLRNAICLTGHG